MRITATEFQKNVATYSDMAQREPVIVASHDRDRFVLLSAEDYRRLTGEREGVTADREAQMRALADKHAATLTELSKR